MLVIQLSAFNVLTTISDVLISLLLILAVVLIFIASEKSIVNVGYGILLIFISLFGLAVVTINKNIFWCALQCILLGFIILHLHFVFIGVLVISTDIQREVNDEINTFFKHDFNYKFHSWGMYNLMPMTRVTMEIHEIDIIQATYDCCGADHFSDWSRARGSAREPITYRLDPAGHAPFPGDGDLPSPYGYVYPDVGVTPHSCCVGVLVREHCNETGIENKLNCKYKVFNERNRITYALKYVSSGLVIIEALILVVSTVIIFRSCTVKIEYVVDDEQVEDEYVLNEE